MSAQANLAGMFPPTEAMRWSCQLIWSGFIIFINACSPPLRQWGGVGTTFEVDLSFLLSYFHSHWDDEMGPSSFTPSLSPIIFCLSIQITYSLPLGRGFSSFALEFVFLIIYLISYAPSYWGDEVGLILVNIIIYAVSVDFVKILAILTFGYLNSEE